MSNVMEIKTGMDSQSARLVEVLSAEEDFSTVLMNASNDGVLAYDLNCKYTLWNPTMERITGLKSEEVVGRVAFDVFPFLRNSEMQKIYETSLQGLPIRSPIIKFTVPETGNTGYSQQHNFPLFDEAGVVTGGLAIVRDLTSIKQRFDLLHAQRRDLEVGIKELEILIEQAKLGS